MNINEDKRNSILFRTNLLMFRKEKQQIYFWLLSFRRKKAVILFLLLHI